MAKLYISGFSCKAIRFGDRESGSLHGNRCLVLKSNCPWVPSLPSLVSFFTLPS